MIRWERAAIDALIGALREEGYQVTGPTIRDGAIIYDEIVSSDSLPVGWTDRQEAGTYRLEQKKDQRFFGFVVGPWSWKRYLFPPQERLWKAKRTDSGFQLVPELVDPPPLAILGARACELHAIAIQDQVFINQAQPDPGYQSRRESLLIVAVNCTVSGGTCFCASMGTGPEVTTPVDLALTEILTEEEHYFLVEIGSERAGEIVDSIPHQPATEAELQLAHQLITQTEQSMGRTLDTSGLKDLLYQNLDHPQWDLVADRCLSCANCTLVCPTCFCSNVEDVTDLTGEHAERWRKWDSCFNQSFSYVHGGSARTSVKSRYRQWMTHKLATWIDQFGTSGCVGCGRCITWCPVGIDITEEAKAIRSSGSGVEQ